MIVKLVEEGVEGKGSLFSKFQKKKEANSALIRLRGVKSSLRNVGGKTRYCVCSKYHLLDLSNLIWDDIHNIEPRIGISNGIELTKDHSVVLK